MLVIDSSNVLQMRTSLSVAGVSENNVEDLILVEYLFLKFIGHCAKISKFRDKGWNVNGLSYLLKKLRDTDTTARQPGSGRRQGARTVENVDTVNDLVLSHKGALKFKMHQTTCQIARETGIHHSPVYSIIHQDFELICLKKRRAHRELTTATVYISQTCRSCYKVE